MKIVVTEEMLKELELFAALDARVAMLDADPGMRDSRQLAAADRSLKATGCRIARLVSAAVEGAGRGTE